jgi:hypothetical protein
MSNSASDNCPNAVNRVDVDVLSDGDEVTVVATEDGAAVRIDAGHP